MLSANVTGNANAHHQIRHRARHGLRGGVASPLQRFALVVPLTPSPASPHEPCRTSSARLMQDPRRSRAFDAAHAPRQRLTQACVPGHPDARSGFRGVEHPASQAGKLDFFLSSTSSPQALSSSSKSGATRRPDHRRRATVPQAGKNHLTSCRHPAASFRGGKRRGEWVSARVETRTRMRNPAHHAL